MIRFIIAIAAAASLACGAAVAAPLEAYGRLPQIEDVAVSSDGAYIATAVTDGEKRGVIVQAAGGTAIKGGVNAGETKVRDLQWAGPRHLLVTYSVTGRIEDVMAARSERYLTIVYDVETGKQTPLFGRNDDKILNITIDRPMVRILDGKATVFVHGVQFIAGVGRTSLFQTVLGTGRTKTLETGTQYTDQFLVDDAGQVVARTDYNQEKGQWSVAVQRDGRWTTVAEGTHPFGSPYLVGLGAEPGTILLEMSDENGVPLKQLKLADGSITDSPIHKPGQSLIRNAVGRVIGSYRLEGDVGRYTFFAGRDQAIWAGIMKAYPTDEVSLTSWSDDHQKIVVFVESVTDGPAFAFVDIPGKTAKWLGPQFKDIGPEDVSPVKPVAYKAADDLEITGYLTTPRGRQAKNLPLIVLPHGGPASRDVLGFDWWAQALASQGYAVLQPNFRGSEGLGDEFLEAGYGEFGRKMQTDLSDGVRRLAADGVIDPKRVCIVGASYGGYAALAGVTLDRGVYRCAASIASIADMGRFMRTKKRDSGDSALRYWANFTGVESARDLELKDISPLFHIDKIDVPVLLVHGKDDTVVLYEQSRIMAEAMTKAGKPVQFVTLEGEDHWLSRGATRQKMLVELVAFLKAHNPPD